MTHMSKRHKSIWKIMICAGALCCAFVSVALVAGCGRVDTGSATSPATGAAPASGPASQGASVSSDKTPAPGASVSSDKTPTPGASVSSDKTPAPDAAVSSSATQTPDAATGSNPAAQANAQSNAQSGAQSGAQGSASPAPSKDTFVPHQTITAEVAKKMMDEADSFILIDARTIEEHQDKRIPGSILIPDYEIIDKAEKKLPDKDALIFVHCRSGVRSERAAFALSKLGYTRVYDIGGINSWPYETISGVVDIDSDEESGK